MKIKILLLSLILASCASKESRIQDTDKTDLKKENIKSKYSYDIFDEKFFSFKELDHVYDNIAKLDSLKKFNKEHYDFFKIKSEWHEAGCYLISKQKRIGNIIPIINYMCDPFDFVGNLYTLDTAYNKIDSTLVFGGSWSSGGDGPYEGNTEIESFFSENRIKTKITNYLWIREKDSTVVQDSVIVFKEIHQDGKIITKSEKKYIINNVP